MNQLSVNAARRLLQELLELRKEGIERLDPEEIRSLVKPAMSVLDDLEVFFDQVDFLELIQLILGTD